MPLDIDAARAECDRSVRVAPSLAQDCYRALDELTQARKDIAMYKDDLDSTTKRLSDAHRELLCPDCKCADQIDAESQECGCDSPVCARSGNKPLAVAYVEARAAVVRLAGAMEALNETVKVSALYIELADQIISQDKGGAMTGIRRNRKFAHKWVARGLAALSDPAVAAIVGGGG